MARWASLFDDVIMCGPLSRGPAPAGFSPYPFPVGFEELAPGGGNTRRAKLAMVRRIPGWAWRTRALARSVDAVYLRCPSNVGAVAAVATGGRTRYRCATYAGVWRDYPQEPRPYRYQRRLLSGRFFEGPVGVFAPRDPGAPRLEPLFSPSHDEREWRQRAPLADAVRARIAGVDRSGPWRLITVGRLTPNKNHTVALAATRLLVDRGFEVSIDVVGDGPERQRLEAESRSSGIADRVRFHGMVDHSRVLTLLAEADLQVLTTRQEGYGKVLLEGMVVGLVPILTDSPMADDISGHGTRGEVVRADLPNEVADAVESLIADRGRWSSMADEARRYAGTHTLEAYGARVREMLEHHWRVELPSPGAGLVT